MKKIKITLTLSIVFILILMLSFLYQWKMTELSDASRHFISYKNLELNITSIKDLIDIHKKNGNVLFLISLNIFKKYFSISQEDFKIFQIIVTLCFYISLFFSFYKIEITLKEMVLIFLMTTNILTPIYIFTIIRFPLAIAMVNCAFLTKRKILKVLFLFLAYGVHSGIIYLILSYLFVIVFNIKIRKIYILFLIVFKYFILENLISNFEGTYFYYKINTYVLSNDKTGIGIATTILTYLTYCYFYYAYKKILNNKIILYKEEVQILNKITDISIILGVFNVVFLFRSLYFLLLNFPYIIVNLKYIENSKDKIKIFIFMIIIIFLGILENRYLLKNIIYLKKIYL